VLARAFDMVAEMIAAAARELKQDLSDHVLFAYGGNGGLFGNGVAERTTIKQVYFFGLGPVFSAFGSSVSDISHVYERSFHLPLTEGADLQPLHQLLQELRDAGRRDLLGEGINPENAEHGLEIEISTGHGEPVMLRTSELRFSSAADLRRNGGVTSKEAAIQLVRLRVKKPISKPALVVRDLRTEDASPALLGKRDVVYGSSSGQAALYRWEKLFPGNRISGCAIVESANSTYFVPEGWTLQMDRYGNAQVTRTGKIASRKSAHLQEARHGK
jgi:acetophenone carboxylase